MRPLTPDDIDALSRHKYNVVDSSITTRVFTGFWNKLLQFMPTHVAPNVITTTGFIICYLAFYIAYTHEASALTSLTVATCIFTYFTLDALDGKQARKTKNSTPLGEIFDHLCDSLSVIPITLSFLWCFGITNPQVLHTSVFIVSCIFLREHVAAIRRGHLVFGSFYGPGEMLMAIVLFLSLRAVDQWCGTLICENYVTPFLNEGMQLYAQKIAIAATFLLFIDIIRCEYSTRNGFALCAGFAVYKWIWHAPPIQGTAALVDTFAVGAYFSVLTCEAILCKMAKPRPLHPLIVVFQLMTVFRFGLADGLLDLCFCAYYLLKLLTQLTNDLSLPLMDTIVRVYVDGIYDLTHYGHVKQLEAARKFVGPGQKCFLIVGVPNDADAKKYKREPIIRMEERVQLLRSIRYVDQIVENAPCNGLTEEFLNQYQIHIVAHGEEYNKPDDQYYAVARKLEGIKTCPIPRTKEISTSEILQRILTRPDLAEKFLKENK